MCVEKIERKKIAKRSTLLKLKKTRSQNKSHFICAGLSTNTNHDQTHSPLFSFAVFSV